MLMVLVMSGTAPLIITQAIELVGAKIVLIERGYAGVVETWRT